MILVVLLAAADLTGFLIFRLGEHYVSIKGQHLNEYRFSSGGGMNGGYHHETVKRYDDTHAFISIERAEWHRKDFTNIFVADGETESYHFEFDKNSVYFSSQIYPERYWKKLSKLDDVIRKYLENANVLPGLVNEKTAEEENYDLPEDRAEMYVCAYSNDVLEVRILNGKEEDLEIEGSFQLINTDTNQVVAEEESSYTTRIYGLSSDIMRFPLERRLDTGLYKLILGDEDLIFEIR